MRRPDERGVGTVLAAGACAALVGVAWVAAVMVSWVSQVSATQDAADLAAMAAASSRAQGGEACDAARAAAERNASEMMACRVAGDGRFFVVEVSVSHTLVPGMPGAPKTVERVAFAGTAP